MTRRRVTGVQMVMVWCLRSAQQRRRWRGGVNEERQREKKQQ